MAIKALENFSGLKPGVVLTNNGSPFGSYQGAWSLSSNGSTISGYVDGPQVEERDGKSWLTSYNTGSRRYGIRLLDVFSAGSNRLVIGWRTARRNPIALGGTELFYVDPNFVLNYAWAAGQEQAYFEFVVDRSDWSAQLWANGRQVWSGTVSAGSSRNILSGATVGYLYFVMGSQSFFLHTDFYFIEDTGDDSPNSRIGPQDITEIPMEIVPDSAVGTWDTVALPDVLTRKYLDDDTGTRVRGEGLDASIKLRPVGDYALPNDMAVNGIGVFIGASYRSGSPGDLNAVVNRGTHSDAQLGILSETSTSPAVKFVNSSRSADESRAATALDGLELTLALSSR